MFRLISSTQNGAFDSYLASICGNFCPFIIPAQQEKVLFFSGYDLPTGDLESAQACIFYLGLLHTELLRRERRMQKTRRAHDLLCENIIFTLPPNSNIDGRQLFSWPHWLLKTMYTRVSVLFGKFWQGEQDVSKDGRAIPIPPVHLLSIRSAIKPVDAKFFTRAPALTDEYLRSCDDGESVLREILGGKAPEALLRAESPGTIEVTKELFLRILHEMLATNYYQDLKHRAEAERQV